MSDTRRLVVLPAKERPGMFRVITPDPAAYGLSPNYGELTGTEVRTIFAGKFDSAEIETWIQRAKASGET